MSSSSCAITISIRETFSTRRPLPRFAAINSEPRWGGPVQKEKAHSFLLELREGFRQRLDQTSAAFVPDAASRASAVAGSVRPLLNRLWPAPPAGAPDFSPEIAEVFSSPHQAIREDFGTARLDHFISSTDSMSAIYTGDDGNDTTATIADPYSSDLVSLREQVFQSGRDAHTFSPNLLNTARIRVSRGQNCTSSPGEPTPGTPEPPSLVF